MLFNIVVFVNELKRSHFVLGDTTIILCELQDKARSMLAQSRASADPTLLHLIEELCRVGENIKEEATRERQDLIQQVSVHDYSIIIY